MSAAMDKDKDPVNLVLVLVARNKRAIDMWAHPHNRPYWHEGQYDALYEDRNDQKPLYDENDEDRKPEVHLSLDYTPKNRALGWIGGSDLEKCDIYCGKRIDGINSLSFSVTYQGDKTLAMNSICTTHALDVHFGKKNLFSPPIALYSAP